MRTRLSDVDAITARLGVLLEGPLQSYIQRLVNRELAPIREELDLLRSAILGNAPRGNGKDHET